MTEPYLAPDLPENVRNAVRRAMVSLGVPDVLSEGAVLRFIARDDRTLLQGRTIGPVMLAKIRAWQASRASDPWREHAEMIAMVGG